jgi:hypothetical protein
VGADLSALAGVEVFTPDRCLRVSFYNQNALDGLSVEGRTSNACRVASQVVTGVKVLEIFILLEGIRALRLPWLPLSLHHDGFTVLAKTEDLKESKEWLEDCTERRDNRVGIRSLELEFTPYDKPIFTAKEILRPRCVSIFPGPGTRLSLVIETNLKGSQIFKSFGTLSRAEAAGAPLKQLYSFTVLTQRHDRHALPQLFADFCMEAARRSPPVQARRQRAVRLKVKRI